jgi:hypothetical protein
VGLGSPGTLPDVLATRSAEIAGAVTSAVARHGVPLALLIASFDTGTTAMMQESWRITTADRLAEMAQFTEHVAQMLEQAREAAICGYLEAPAGIDRQSARRDVAEALIGGEPAAAIALIGERLAPGYLVLVCAAPDPAQVDAGQVAVIHQDIESLPGALHCGDLATLVVLLPVEDSRRAPEATARDMDGLLVELAGTAGESR